MSLFTTLPLPSWPLCLFAVLTFALLQAARPFVSLYLHARRASRIGLPVKILPVPQGAFSFFAFQLARRLPQHIRIPCTGISFEIPGVQRLHAVLNMGRPDGYGLHAELGDVFVTVNPMGITLVVADPDVAAYICGRRAEFPKPPNTGAIINLYGRNVINAERNDVQGDVWRLHRRVTAAAFSERIHADVWAEARTQASYMLDSWTPNMTKESASFVVGDLGSDSLRLGMNVITGCAYGQKLAWSPSTSAASARPYNPPTTDTTPLSYRESLEEVTHHLMPLFLTPHWLLRLAPSGTNWGRAWEAYRAFGGYMQGMLDAQAQKTSLEGKYGADEGENLLDALLRGREEGQEGGRRMTQEEVLGNAFIFLFAGHETTANTLHYALLRLALHPDIQAQLLDEVDTLYSELEEDEELDYATFERAVWCRAVMNETLRVHTPTGIINKYTYNDSVISISGKQHIIPSGTRIAINGTGIHFNPNFWGPAELDWSPQRWVTFDDYTEVTNTLLASGFPSTRRSDGGDISPGPLTPTFDGLALDMGRRGSDISSCSSAASSSPPSTGSRPRLAKPRRGTFMPFSEGARACSGKKFAAVEFVQVICTLLREWRVEILPTDEGWGSERVLRVLAGRKAGALTLQPPESVPVRFVRRNVSSSGF